MPEPIIPPANQPPLSHTMARNPPPRVSPLAVASLVLALLAIPGMLMVVESHPDKVSTGDKLAVGLKGVMLYGAILTGKAGSEADPAVGKEQKTLLPYFPNPEKKKAEAETAEE